MGQRQEVTPQPLDDEKYQNGSSHGKETATQCKSGLQLEISVKSIQSQVFFIESPGPGVRPGVESQAENLKANHAKDSSENTGDTGCRPPIPCYQTEQHCRVDQYA